MTVCGSFQQTQSITLDLVDNRKRVDPLVEVKMHYNQETYVLPVTKLSSNRYEVVWTAGATGVGVMEVFFDGAQIPQSPVRISVDDRQCEEDYPGEKRENSENGDCVCRSGTVDIRGSCIESIVIAISVSVLAVAVIMILGAAYLRYKTKMADQMWHVEIGDLRVRYFKDQPKRQDPLLANF